MKKRKTLSNVRIQMKTFQVFKKKKKRLLPYILNVFDFADYGSIRRNPNFQNPDDGLQVIGTMSAEEIRQEKLSIWKNVSVISLSWMFLFTAYNAVANLQV